MSTPHKFKVRVALQKSVFKNHFQRLLAEITLWRPYPVTVTLIILETVCDRRAVIIEHKFEVGVTFAKNVILTSRVCPLAEETL